MAGKKPSRQPLPPEPESGLAADLDETSPGLNLTPNMNAVDHIRAAVANLKANAPDRGLPVEHVRAILKLESAERMIHQRSGDARK